MYCRTHMCGLTSEGTWASITMQYISQERRYHKEPDSGIRMNMVVCYMLNNHKLYIHPQLWIE